MAYQFWLDELSLLAPGTRDYYVRYFNKYIEARGWSAEELYSRQRALMVDGDPRTNRELVRDVSEFVRGMVETGYSIYMLSLCYV